MQNPVGAEFNFDTMRMEVTSFTAVMFNPVAQSKFVHTVSAGYVLGSMFVLSISAWYLLRGRNIDFAKRSMTVAASFGLASALSVVVLGDESGYTVSENQKMKLAAIEAMWDTEPPPASFTAVRLSRCRRAHDAFRDPYSVGHGHHRHALARRRAARHQRTGRRGRAAHRTRTHRLRGDADACVSDRDDAQARAAFDANKHDLGYALLLKRDMADPAQASAADVQRAAESTIPNVPVLFWSFRIMVGCGMYFIALFAWSFWLARKRRLDANRWYLKLALWSLPLPWLAIELGWIVAEYGRQPWAIEGVLPTALGVSSVSAGQVLFSISGFVVFYTALAVIDAMLMTQVRAARAGWAGHVAAPAPCGAWLGPDLPSPLASVSLRECACLPRTPPSLAALRL